MRATPVLAACLGAALLVCTQAALAACARERVFGDYLRRNLERTPAAQFHVIEEPLKTAFLARFNAVDPPTSFAPETAGYFATARLTDGTTVAPKTAGYLAVVVLASDGCIDYAGPVPVAALARMLQAASDD